VSRGTAHLAAGRAAEAAACSHLERRGYRIVTRNFRARGGELDIVAIEDDVLAVVEVRYRASSRYGSGAESITWAKRQRIVRATLELLAREPALARYPVRFDVVEVEGSPDEGGCRLLQGAFSL
jgi:putative endonuclease